MVSVIRCERSINVILVTLYTPLYNSALTRRSCDFRTVLTVHEAMKHGARVSATPSGPGRLSGLRLILIFLPLLTIGAVLVFAWLNFPELPVPLSSNIELEGWRSWVVTPALGLIGIATILSVLIYLCLRIAENSAPFHIYMNSEAPPLSHAEEGAQHHPKVESIGQLAHGVAHDFNNLLMVIGTNLHIMKVKLTDDSFNLTREMNAIDRSVIVGQALTRQLLTVSHRQALSVETIHVESKLPEIIDLIERLLGPQVNFQYSFAPGSWPVRIDASEFELALVNLAVNARDAMPDGGGFTIDVGNITLLAKNRNADNVDLPPGDFLMIRVTDTGQGIDAAIIPRLFEPYFTTKDKGKGSGLGLAQVHDFARMSGGDVVIKSSPGKGTTFTLFLPRAEPELTTEHDRRISVLIHNPRDKASESLWLLLDQLGYRVGLVRDAQDILSRLDDENPWNLLLIDSPLNASHEATNLVEEILVHAPDLTVIVVLDNEANSMHERPKVRVLRRPFQVRDLTLMIAALAGQGGATLHD